MKTSELTGPLLDYWVARAEGKKDARVFNENSCWYRNNADDWEAYQPTVNWSQGGPIIEREEITIYKARACWLSNCPAHLDDDTQALRGATPLEAAMRCHVASKFGEEVPDEI